MATVQSPKFLHQSRATNTDGTKTSSSGILELSFFDHSANVIGALPDRLQAVIRNKKDTVPH